MTEVRRHEAMNENAPLMYLPENHWSPRYNATFYTIHCNGFALIKDNPPDVPSEMQGKTSLPAYYYSITVCREHDKRIIQRRYSHFWWLYQQIKSHPLTILPSHSVTTTTQPIEMPSGTCPFFFHRQDDHFAATRQERLSQFLQDVLGRPGYANHAAVKIFLELK
ncbi:hypothetical protein FisN_14Hu331 [Fistulifera solaris]|jgi:hypothetical protein|uniref:PX domain-containing protein n=1 Tax=Fistulifera solaris TaxID=1519565 RepID=A0A1Z5KBB6_FISSO|nr:hypothetical protein FisN_14Hu331 [Fistulifera solaris]|eukprot:GAX23496.1 hypothetical protein FisN_14Hu331 [Fistulifera solaris]